MSDTDTQTIDEMLEERGARYGEFGSHAELTQSLKAIVLEDAGYVNLGHDHREALDMIFHKIGRIVNGDPDYRDSWDDIAGYAKLVSDRILVDEQGYETNEDRVFPEKVEYDEGPVDDLDCVFAGLPYDDGEVEDDGFQTLVPEVTDYATEEAFATDDESFEGEEPENKMVWNKPGRTLLGYIRDFDEETFDPRDWFDRGYSELDVFDFDDGSCVIFGLLESED